ncbi:MAG TPA: hypothetical protein VFH78_07090 [Candidatus Thermoplasmatota archaeon]|nr:hypothetical protein [Candidatus Thermoplasmatota archaeon]
MATAAKVLDETRFEARARIGDVIALGLVVVVGAALLFNMYTLGYTAGELARGSGDVVARDKRFVMAIIEAALVVSGFAWIVYRLFSGSARRVGG